MRIIAGKFKGRRLQTPSNNNIRPTTDRMRETLFNLIGHGPAASYYQGHVLDLFAGTGALGLEALSRGAKHVTFVENDRNAAQLIRRNIDLCQASACSSLLIQDACHLSRPRHDYTTIFMDPPYHKDLLTPTVGTLLDNGYITEQTLIVAEKSVDDDFNLPPALQLLKERKYGASHMMLISHL